MRNKIPERAGHGDTARPDAQLMAEMRAPDGDALAALIQRYGRLVKRVATDILRDAGEAEDVTQDVFWEIYQKAHLYDPARGSVRVWLLQYAYHRSLRRKDALRRRAAYRGEPLEGIEAAPQKHGAQLSRDECRWILEEGLAHLPERQRRTLELVCLEQLTLRDVAERFQVTLGCVRHYYYRGLARLKSWALPASRRSRVPSTDAPRSGGITRAPAAGARRGVSTIDTTGVATTRAPQPSARV